MKKFLALVLALVMTMSLVTIGASAKIGFTDDAKITNEEAVEVLNAMGILTGYADGSFRPQANLTRGSGAKLVAYLTLGQAAADKLQATYTVFEDVDDTVGQAAYIEWAAARGIVDGYGNGKFGPRDTLTEYAFGKMLLTALGYVSSEEGFTGAGWQKNVYGIAVKNGVFDGTETYGACTRDTAARMAFAALQADLVVYGKVSNIWIQRDEDGRKNQVASILNNIGVITTEGAVETGIPLYKNYTGLSYSDAPDVWGNPGHTWSYGSWSKFYKDAAVLTYKEAVDDCALLVDLGIPVSSSETAVVDAVYYNAQKTTGTTLQHKTTHAACNDYFFGGQGVLTQVYQKANGHYVITEVATYLAVVDSVTNNHAGVTANVNVYYRNLNGFGRTAANQLADSSAISEQVKNATLVTSDYAKGDYLLVTVDSTKADASCIVDHKVASGVEGTLSGYKSAVNAYPEASQTYVNAKSEKDAFGFDVGYGASKADASISSNFIFFYDSYGNVIGMVAPYVATVYAVIDAIWAYDTENGVHTIKADTVTMDAAINSAVNVKSLNSAAASAVSESVIDENKLATQNVNHCYQLYTYNVDASGNWTLADANATRVTGIARTAVDQYLPYAGGRYVLDNKTQVLVRDVDGNYKAYTGYENLPILTASYAEAIDANEDNVVDVVYIHNAIYTGSTVEAYIANVADKWALEYNGVKYNVYTIYVDGVETNAYVEQGSAMDAAIAAAGSASMFEITFSAVDGLIVVKSIRKLGAADGYWDNNITIESVGNGLIKFSTNPDFFALSGVAVYTVDDHNNVAVGSVDDLAAGLSVEVVLDGNFVSAIYVHVQD